MNEKQEVEHFFIIFIHFVYLFSINPFIIFFPSYFRK